jgi:2,3-bisphosphoglycerate-dependent phosphoglycerate mutase
MVMKSGGTVYLFRHGQSTFNRDGKFTGFIDAKLTAKGRAHARIIAKKMKNKKFQVAIHTRLSRSKDTLAPVLKNHPECKVILQDDRMTERSYGELAGSTHKGFIERIGKQEYDLRVHGDAIENLEPELRKKVENFLGKEEYKAIHRGWRVAARGGESFADVEKRVKKFIKDLKKLIKKNNCNVAISAHGNSIRLFRKVMEKATIEQTTKWFIPYDKVFEYRIK